MPTRPLPMPDALSMRATERRATFFAILAVPCKTHHARAGQPCWTIPRDCTSNAQALCGPRIQRAREQQEQPKLPPPVGHHARSHHAPTRDYSGRARRGTAIS